MAGRLVIAPPDLGGRPPLYDITRLVRHRGRAFGTGVDRLDLAVALALLSAHGRDCAFVIEGPFGPEAIDHATGAAFLAALDRRWSGAREAPFPAARILAARARGLAGAGLRRAAGHVYVNASHNGLPRRPGFMRRLDPSGTMARYVYVHDLMPIEYPEYHRPHTRAQFESFLSEAVSPNARLGANSADTARRLSAYLAGRGSPERPVEVLMPRLEPGTVPPGAVRPEVARILSGPRRYFLCIGTIEPRKNHLLLLAIWRDLAREGLAPLLVLCGRRGWENEMVIDLLERCAAIRPHVAEFGDLSDREIDALLKGAAALLFPSFTEGLGLPLMEAGLAGTPAVVSDLPALREFAPPGTTFLHPLDGPAWRRAVLSRASPEETAGGGQGT